MEDFSTKTMLKNKNHRTKLSATYLSFVLFLTACGGGDTDSNNVAFGGPGNTPFAGNWAINANIDINAGGTTTSVNQTSTALVASNGQVGISTTNVTGSLNINFNGSRLNYQTVVLVNNGIDNAGVCTISVTGAANVVGSSTNASASGSFPTQTFICNGAAISITGNIFGSLTP